MEVHRGEVRVTGWGAKGWEVNREGRRVALWLSRGGRAALLWLCRAVLLACVLAVQEIRRSVHCAGPGQPGVPLSMPASVLGSGGGAPDTRSVGCSRCHSSTKSCSDKPCASWPSRLRPAVAVLGSLGGLRLMMLQPTGTRERATPL